jgi:hypothetical protein
VQRERWKVVGRGRERIDVVELRHESKAAVETEASAVVAATQGLEMSFTFHHDGSSVCAYVAETPPLSILGVGQHQRLVETPLEERDGHHVSRSTEARDVAHVLPTPGEHTLPLSLVDIRIVIESGRQRARAPDVGIDMVWLGHRRREEGGRATDAHGRRSNLMSPGFVKEVPASDGPDPPREEEEDEDCL